MKNENDLERKAIALAWLLAASDCRPLVQALKATKPRPATAQWSLFLRNHDELDLGRWTKEQRQRVFECFGAEKEMQLYERGIDAGSPPC